MSNIKKALTEICSALEYLQERGELDYISEIKPEIRYTNNSTDNITVKCGGQKIKITAKLYRKTK